MAPVLQPARFVRYRKATRVESGLANQPRKRGFATAGHSLPRGLSLAREQATLPLKRIARLRRGLPLFARSFPSFRAKRPKFALLSRFQIPETMHPAKVHRVPRGRSAGATLRRPRRSSVKSKVSQRWTESCQRFYGTCRAKFSKTCAKQKSGVCAVVPVMTWSG